uniref:rRNA N-glycosylase n=1 Tax=Oryza glumipatula TaxID=40148 RepID=A0A0D9Z7J7_9ORYZ
MAITFTIKVVVLLSIILPVTSFEKDPLRNRHLWANPTVLRFDFVREAYHAILRTFIAFITSTSSMLRVYDIVILKIQRPVSEAPESWNMAHLIGRDGDETMLSMRDDNLYVLGFANRSGDWHAFERHAHLFREDVTPLKINDNYGSLLGGHRGHKDLPRIAHGQQAVLDAIQALSNYDPSTTDDRILGDALATLIVTLPEAVRLRKTRDWQLRGWPTGTHLTSKLADEVVKWRVMTCGLLVSHRNNGWWGGEEARDLYGSLRIANKFGAMERVGVMLWPARGKCSEEVLDEWHISKIRRDMMMVQQRG